MQREVLLMSRSKLVKQNVETALQAAEARPSRMVPKPPSAMRLMLEGRERERLDYAIATQKTGRIENMGAHAGVDDSAIVYVDDLPPADQAVEIFLRPPINEQLARPGSSLTGYSIMEEIHSARMTGTLRPFVEGEPIGAYEQIKARPPIEIDRNQIMEDRRKAMLRLRAKNDRALDGLTGVR